MIFININLLKQVLIISLSAGIITTEFVQKFKILFKKKISIILFSFLVSMLLGSLFCLTFSDISFYNSLWVGLITFIDADGIYKIFEGKVFKKYSELKQYKIIERSDLSA